jgi:hypothetical protein
VAAAPVGLLGEQKKMMSVRGTCNQELLFIGGGGGGLSTDVEQPGGEVAGHCHEQPLGGSAWVCARRCARCPWPPPHPRFCLLPPTLDRSGKKLFSGRHTMYWMLSKPVPLWPPVMPMITLLSTYTG